FFGGAGVLAYGVAWALVPEEGTAESPIDRVTDELHRHHIPVWLVVTLGVIIGWSALFSWWTPWGFGPVVLAAVILGVAFSRRPPGPDVGLPSSQHAHEAAGSEGTDTTTRLGISTVPSAAALRRERRGAGRV